MKKCIAILAVLVGVIGLSAATCCLPCSTTAKATPPEAPPAPVVLGPSDAASSDEDDAGTCEAPDGAAVPSPIERACVPRKDLRALCVAVRPFCGPN